MQDTRVYRFFLLSNGCIPLLFLGWDAFYQQLGAHAVNQAIHITGILSLVFLFMSLTITPLRRLTGWSSLIAYRRGLGLFGFVYAFIHLGIYVVLDREGNIASALEEIVSRRYLLVGGIAISLMFPLAITSTNFMMRWIGPRRWKSVHRLVYLIAILGVTHYYLSVKSDVRQPLAFAAILSPLLGIRVLNQYWGPGRNPHAKWPARNAHSTMARAGFWKGKLEVAKIVQETHNVKTFRLQLPSGLTLPFRYQAGQYLNIQFLVDGKVVRRSYTISSSPTNSRHCEITVKREDMGAASRHLHDCVCEGTTLEIAAPAGRFVFDDSRHAAVTLISGGVGITPMMSITRSLTERSWPGDIYFIHAARTPRDIIFHNELERMAERSPNLHLYITLTGSWDSLTWKGATGRLSEQALRAIVSDIGKHPAHVCGPGPMMEATGELLRNVGVPDRMIFTEAFDSPIRELGDPDTNLHTAGDDDLATDSVIDFSKSQVVTTATSQDSILDAAEAVGVRIAWECRSGICGQCKVRLLQGTVRMDSEGALSPKERNMGYILSCQAHPKSPVVIEA